MKRFFVLLSGAFFTLTAIAKLISSAGRDPVLQEFDPLVHIPFRQLFWITSLLELCVAIACFSVRSVELRARLVAWLATVFLAYRIGLWWIGYHRPCGCLGNLAGMLHISSAAADISMKILLAFLLIGSYAPWWSCRINARKPASSSGRPPKQFEQLTGSGDASAPGAFR